MVLASLFTDARRALPTPVSISSLTVLSSGPPEDLLSLREGQTPHRGLGSFWLGRLKP